jgi:hypothetical protein
MFTIGIEIGVSLIAANLAVLFIPVFARLTR